MASAHVASPHVMPPVTPEAQHLLDGIVATGADRVPDSALVHRLHYYRMGPHVSPLQCAWQQGVFLRLALQHGRLSFALKFAEWFVKAIGRDRDPGKIVFCGFDGRGDARSVASLLQSDHRRASQFASDDDEEEEEEEEEAAVLAAGEAAANPAEAMRARLAVREAQGEARWRRDNARRDAAVRSLGTLELRGATQLLFMVYYAPLFPDLGASLDLFRQVVRTIQQHWLVPSSQWPANACLDPNWFASVVQADRGMFYSPLSDPTWYDDVRRDYTHAAACHLFRDGHPLPAQLDLHPTALLTHLARMPASTGAVVINLAVHRQTRGEILAFRIAVQSRFPASSDADRREQYLATIDRYVEMHAPPTDAEVSPVQARVMDSLIEQMMRHSMSSGLGDPANLTSLVMNYVRRDESTPAEGSKLTPYRQRELDHMRRHVGEVHLRMAREQVASASSASSSSSSATVPTASRPREGEAKGEDEEDEGDAHQRRARLQARFATRW